MSQESLPLTRESQSQKILAALQNGERLTPMDALQRFQCFRLSGRVKDLRDSGHNIKSRMIETDSKKHVAQYWIDPNDPLIPRNGHKKEKKIGLTRLKELAREIAAGDLLTEMTFSKLIIAAEKE